VARGVGLPAERVFTIPTLQPDLGNASVGNSLESEIQCFRPYKVALRQPLFCFV